MDHVEKAVGDVEPVDLVERGPASLGGVGAGFDPVGVGIGEVVHEHPMIPDPTVAIAHDARDDAGHVDHAHVAAALLGDLTADGVDRGLAELHHPAGQAPLPRRRLATAPDQEHAVDRKSTRLNSSHVKNSYAVFCLKKKKKNKYPLQHTHKNI